MKSSPCVVLMVEDSDSDTELAQVAIRQERPQARVDLIATGAALEGYLEGSRVSPAIVFMDLRLPDAGGIELTRLLRSVQMFRRTPIVVFSTSTNPRDVVAAREAGANDYQVKPLDPQAYLQAVSQTLRRWAGC